MVPGIKKTVFRTAQRSSLSLPPNPSDVFGAENHAALLMQNQQSF